MQPSSAISDNMGEHDKDQIPNDLGKPNLQRRLYKLFIRIASGAVSGAVIIFGIWSDALSVFSGCNATEVPRQIEKVDVSKLKFKKYQGRYGCSFLYPEDWELSIDNPAGDRELRHPTNPEISIVYADMYYPVNFEDIQELGEHEGGFIKESNGRIISHTHYKRYYDSCDRAIEFGKIAFLIRSNGEKAGIVIYTKQDNEVLYSLRIECPEEDYEAHKELMKHIISSITFDCKKMYDY